MPKLWTETIATHRQSVESAVMQATLALVSERGPSAVTMSAVAERAGIGRATLYKYFPNVETILASWHREQVDAHLARLEAAAASAAEPGAALDAVLDAYASVVRERRTGHAGHADPGALHQGDAVVAAERRLHGLLSQVLAAARRAGAISNAAPTGELAHYCLRALEAAGDTASTASRRRLVATVRGGLGARD